MTVQMEGMYADNDQASEARGASGGSQFVSGTESEAPSKKAAQIKSEFQATQQTQT